MAHYSSSQRSPKLLSGALESPVSPNRIELKKGMTEREVVRVTQMRIPLRNHDKIQQIQNTQDSIVPKLRHPERPPEFSQVQKAKTRFISLHIQSH